MLTRDNSTAAEVFDALTARDVPVEIVGLGGLVRLPEVAEVVAHLALLHDLTANADAAHPADRSALGDRSARPRASRPPCPRPRRRRGPPAMPTSLADELDRRSPARDPSELLGLCDALDDPGDRPTHRRRASGSPCSPRSSGCCGVMRASRCSTWCA